MRLDNDNVPACDDGGASFDDTAALADVPVPAAPAEPTAGGDTAAAPCAPACRSAPWASNVALTDEAAQAPLHGRPITDGRTTLLEGLPIREPRTAQDLIITRNAEENVKRAAARHAADPAPADPQSLAGRNVSNAVPWWTSTPRNGTACRPRRR